MPNREKAINKVQELDIDTIYEWQELGHTGNTSQWVEVWPDGDIVVTEEADDRTSHWISYPNKEVARILVICSSSSQYCNCYACAIASDYDDYIDGEIDRQEFIDKWEFAPEDMANDDFLDILSDCDMLIDPNEIRNEMIYNIQSIYQGYFDDEIV